MTAAQLSAAADLARAVARFADGGPFTSFALEDWRQRGDGMWVSPAGHRTLSDANYRKRLAAKKRATQLGQKAAAVAGGVAMTTAAAAQVAHESLSGTAVGRAALTAGQVIAGRLRETDRQAGELPGAIGQAVITGARAAGKAIASATADTLVGRTAKWVATTKAGRGFVKDVQHRANALFHTFQDMRTKGLLTGAALGAFRVVNGMWHKFRRDRLRFGLAGALGVEAAAFLAKVALPVGLAVKAGAIAAAVGSGPLAAAGGAVAAGGLAAWAANKLFGGLFHAVAVRPVLNTVAAIVHGKAHGTSPVRQARPLASKLKAATGVERERLHSELMALRQSPHRMSDGPSFGLFAELPPGLSLFEQMGLAVQERIADTGRTPPPLSVAAAVLRQVFGVMPTLSPPGVG